MFERRLTFSCKLLEDLHSGSGVGRLKTIDDCHARDAVGRPVVWYSMLAGLLRDAAEELAELQHPLATAARVKRLFGTEGQAVRSALVCRSLHFDRPNSQTAPASAGGDQTVVARTAADLAALFVSVASTAREVHSRRPLDETLRTVEYAIAGVVAGGELRFRGDDDDERLLKLCLQRLLALGGGRSRGAGRIRVSEVQVQSLPESATDLLVRGPASRRLRLVLKNLEPLCLPATAYPGNILDTETYLPGSTLRCAVLTALRPGGLASDQDLERLAAGDGAQFTNGYFVSAELLDRGGELPRLGSIPLPLTAKEAKATALPGGSSGIPWWVETDRAQQPWLSNPSREQDSLWKERETESVAEAVTSSFKRVKTDDYLITADGTTWYRQRPAVVTLMRNRTPVRRQDRGFDSRRPGATEDNDLEKADLFSEIVLAEDQCFVCDLIFGSDVAAEAFLRAAAPLLAADEAQRAWLRVGRGGRPVRVERVAWLANALTPQRASPPKGKEHSFSLTLTSDLIARSPDLTFRTTLDATTLVQLAEFTGDEAAQLAKGLVVDSQASLSETRIVHGFNTAAGARRSPALGIRRGSAFVIQPAAGDASGALRLFQELTAREQAGQGLGERTEEGFGRFCLNHPAHRALPGVTPADVPDRHAKMKSGTEAPPDARSEREQVIEKVLQAVDELDLTGAAKKEGQFPGRSQWQRLRHEVEAVSTESDSDGRARLSEIVGRLASHARMLGGRVWACPVRAGARRQPLHAAIADGVKQFETASKQRTFLIYLCRWVVAELDRAADQQRRRERGEEKHA